MIIRKLILIGILLQGTAIAFGQGKKAGRTCQDSCCTHAKQDDQPEPGKIKAGKEQEIIMACKLTTPELQKRKLEVISSLKSKVTGHKELSDGFAYLFVATDAHIDEVVAFIKTERRCCGFFRFRMSVAENDLWLFITGEQGVKEFIRDEIGL